jgi:hypothetical protein
VLRSRNRICKGPHHFGADGAETVKRRGSGSDGSGSKHDVPHILIIEKNINNSNSFLLFPFTFKTTSMIKKLE